MKSVLAAGTVFAILVCPSSALSDNFLKRIPEIPGLIVKQVRSGVALTRVHSRSGRTAVVNSAHASKFQCLISRLDDAGYRIDFMGGYSYRNIAGTNRLSKHAFGNAIDINQTARNRVTRRLPHNVNSMASGCGLLHGSVWRHPDAGHFEVPGGASRQVRVKKHPRHRGRHRR